MDYTEVSFKIEPKSTGTDILIAQLSQIGYESFMESEDWSNRLPETKEFLDLCDKQRGISFSETFPEMKDIFNGL